MNSNLAYVLTIMESLLDEASTQWPESASRFRKDLSYLRRAAEQRGLAFFTLTLPDLGKAFDRSLAEASFLASEVPLGVPMIKKRPELFGDLYMKVFCEGGKLRSDADATAVHFFRQLTYCFKKLRLDCTPEKVQGTLDEFFAVESELPPSYPCTWDDNVPYWQERHGHPLGDYARESDTYMGNRESLPWDTLRRISRYVISNLGVPDYWELEPKHGPGVVSETSGWISKYEFPHWPKKLGLFYPFDWFATGILDTIPDFSEDEPPSRLIAVPKTQKGPRLICAEPIAHQWMQQSIWRWIDGRSRNSLLSETIRFRDQEVSRMRALHASIDGSNCTIDLSAASDRLSTRLVEYIFQGSPLLDHFHASRTRYLEQNLSSKHPKRILLRKFSPMGSALTFPVQSIVFTILSLWGLKLTEGTEGDLSTIEKDLRRITVFGDDIIAPTAAYPAIERVLYSCGLKVNASKSFFKGNFRESCGMDAFRGNDVTPAYILGSYNGSPSSMATVLETSNNFHKSGFWKTASTIVSLLPEKEKKLLLIVGEDGGGLGLFSYCGRKTDHLKMIWNPNLQREECIALTVTSKVTKRQGRALSSLTQYFTERPNPQFKWTSGQASFVKLRKGLTRVPV